MKHITKRHIAELMLLSEITAEIKLNAVRVVKTIKGMAWVITQRFNKFSWSRKEMAVIRKEAKARYNVLKWDGNESRAVKNALASLGASFNEAVYLNLMGMGVL